VEPTGELLPTVEWKQKGGKAQNFLPLTEQRLRDHSSHFRRDHFDTLDRLGDHSPDVGGHVYAQHKTRPTPRIGIDCTSESGGATFQKDDCPIQSSPSETTAMIQKLEVGFASNEANVGWEQQQHRQEQEKVPMSSSQLQQVQYRLNSNARGRNSALGSHPKEFAGAQSILTDRDINGIVTNAGKETGHAKILTTSSRLERGRNLDLFIPEPKSLLQDFINAAATRSGNKDRKEIVRRPSGQRDVMPKSAARVTSSKTKLPMPPKRLMGNSTSRIRRISLGSHCDEQHQESSSKLISKRVDDNRRYCDKQQMCESSKFNSDIVGNGLGSKLVRRSSSASTSSSSCWSKDWNFSCVSDGNSQVWFDQQLQQRRDGVVSITKEGAAVKLEHESRPSVKSLAKLTSSTTKLRLTQTGKDGSKKKIYSVTKEDAGNKGRESRQLVKSMAKLTSTKAKFRSTRTGKVRSKKVEVELDFSGLYDKVSASKLKTRREPLVESSGVTQLGHIQQIVPERFRPHSLATKQLSRSLALQPEVPRPKLWNGNDTPPPNQKEKESIEELIRSTKFDLNSDDVSVHSEKENMEGFVTLQRDTRTRTQRKHRQDPIIGLKATIGVIESDHPLLQHVDLDNDQIDSQMATVPNTESDPLSQHDDVDNNVFNDSESDLFGDALSMIIHNRTVLSTSFATIRLRMSKKLTHSKRVARWLLPIILLLTLAGGNSPMKVYQEPISISTLLPSKMKHISLPPPIHFVSHPFRAHEVYLSRKIE
jgi:hypothetical protein